MHKLMSEYAKKRVVPVGRVNGAIISEEYELTSSSEEEFIDDQEYEKEFVQEEMKQYAQCRGQVSLMDRLTMSEVEGIEGMDLKNNPLNIYSTYNFNQRSSRKDLPIDHFKDKILQMIEVNSVLLIQGPTGCGKTTQVPQYILDQCKERREYCNIVVTQPRKIATISVARRVCEERHWVLGKVCGYQVGLETQADPDTILTYMTTGVLLQKLIATKTLHHYTHIIIDEVHERNGDLDFLLIIVRRFLYTHSPKTKVILMSATFDADEFAYYFRTQTLENVVIPAPIIQVNKKSNFSSVVFYLDNIESALVSTRCQDITFDIDKPEIHSKIWDLFVFLVSIIDKLDQVHPTTNEKIVGSILVFLPGIHEIEEASRLLNFHSENERMYENNQDGSPKLKWQIIPLHSSLPNTEQAAAFGPAREGHRKVILSTNIAESSVTVPDSYYVIDFCQTKVMTVDPITKYMSLKLEWASHVNCDQRAGRVGRIGNGRVYRLVRRKFYEEKMSIKSIPEILRAPLERVVLQSKMLNFHDTPQQILALAINPPNLRSISTTILTLKEVGGLMQTSRGNYTPFDGDLTFMGTIMAQLPVDVRLSKLIVLGHLFSCLKETIIMAAGCSIQNIFSTPFQRKLHAYKKLLLWADGSASDPIALLNLYQVWQAKVRDNEFHNIHVEYRWCSLNLVNYKGLREWQVLVKEITDRLERVRIVPVQGQPHLNQCEKMGILKIAIAGAFYPNYFIRQPNDTELDEREVVKAVGGRNPFRTVFLTGLDSAQPGPLYVRFIKKMFKSDVERDMSIGFDGSTKIYVEFNPFDTKRVTVFVNGKSMLTEAAPEKIPSGVYEAIRARQLKHSFSLGVLPVQEAWSLAESRGIERKTTLQKLEYSRKQSEVANCYSIETQFNPIPSLDIEWISIQITEFIDAGHFWANTFESESKLAAIEQTLNKMVLQGVIASGETVKLGKLYAAKFTEDNMYYRCRVITSMPSIIQVIFVDYGNIQQVKPEDLRLLPNTPECQLSPLGVECVLYGIQPCRKTNPNGFWAEDINNHWKNQLLGFLLFGKVHSVVDNVVSLEIYKNQPNTRNVKSINQIMLDKNHAEPAVESFLSKEDRQKRLQVIKAENPGQEAFRLSFDNVTNCPDVDVPDVNFFNSKPVQLKGPFSPLEVKFHGLLENTAGKSVEVEGNSVNTVLLESDLHNYHTRLLVAGCVTQSQTGNRLKLRQTTMMENIPGLPMLLALMFCPTMKPKVTNDETRVASILCGLGYNIYTNKPYYPEHDFNLALDTLLTETDINQVNKIRFTLNQGIKLLQNISLNMACEEEIIRTQISLKQDMSKLLTGQRTSVERTNVNYATSWSKSNVDLLLLKPKIADDIEATWPLLRFVELKKLRDFNPNTSKNLDDLDLIAREMLPAKDSQCILCDARFFDINEVRLHLISQTHKDNVLEYLED